MIDNNFEKIVEQERVHEKKYLEYQKKTLEYLKKLLSEGNISDKNKQEIYDKMVRIGIISADPEIKKDVINTIHKK